MSALYLISSKVHLSYAADSLSVAYWTKDNYHVLQARNHLTKALCGDDTPTAEITALVERAIPLLGTGED